MNDYRICFWMMNVKCPAMRRLSCTRLYIALSATARWWCLTMSILALIPGVADSRNWLSIWLLWMFWQTDPRNIDLSKFMRNKFLRFYILLQTPTFPYILTCTCLSVWLGLHSLSEHNCVYKRGTEHLTSLNLWMKVDILVLKKYHKIYMYMFLLCLWYSILAGKWKIFLTSFKPRSLPWCLSMVVMRLCKQNDICICGWIDVALWMLLEC